MTNSSIKVLVTGGSGFVALYYPSIVGSRLSGQDKLRGFKEAAKTLLGCPPE